MLELFDALAFSGLWVAAVAAALLAAVSVALGGAPDPPAALLAFAGTFAVYGIDRLRDQERDGARAPLRTAFVRRHRSALVAATACAVVAAAAAVLFLGSGALAVAAVAGGFGLLHRRLKDRVLFKSGYVAASWVLVVVGLPALSASAPPRAIALAAAMLGAALLANAITFNVRDGEGAAARLGPFRALAIATGLAAFGGTLGLFARGPLRGLAAVPIATLAAVLGFRASERYVHGAVDGALLAGSLLAIALG